MTTYGAYDRGLPCHNPACRSYGKPHPNCRCYGEYAEGGEAHFCASERSHERDCEYFAEGGAAEAPDFIPDEPAAPTAIDDSPDFIPDEPAANDAPDFIPDEPSSDDNANLSPAELQAKMFQKAYPNGPGPMESPAQQLATVGEAVGRGQLGPLFTAGETALGVPAEDIEARRTANPIEAAAAETASLIAPTSVIGKGAKAIGEGARALGNAAKLAVDFAELGKVGSAVVRGAGEMMALHASDEATKAILGHGNPEAAHAPFSALGAVAVLGGFLGGAGELISTATTKFLGKAIEPLAAEADMMLSGLGAAQRGESLEKIIAGLPQREAKWLKRGYEAYTTFPEKIGDLVKSAGAISGGAHGISSGFGAGAAEAMAGYATGKIASYLVEPLAEGTRNRVGKYLVPAMNRWLGGGARGSMFHVKNYVERVAQGESRINNALDSLFKAGSSRGVDLVADPKRVDRLRKWVDDGGMTPHIEAEAIESAPQGFAKGGMVGAQEKAPGGVHTDDIGTTFPEQAALLGAARGRLSTYLSAQRPQEHTPRLAYDGKPDHRQAKKDYDHALKIAVAPLSVVKRIGDGSLTAKDMGHLQSMYPELVGMLRQKMTDRIAQDQVDGKKPPYKVRQALSLFMGVPLTSELTPMAIQAAQSTFAKNQASQMPQAGGKKAPKQGHSSALSKSDRAYLTDDQARETRAQRAR